MKLINFKKDIENKTQKNDTDNTINSFLLEAKWLSTHHRRVDKVQSQGILSSRQILITQITLIDIKAIDSI